MIRAMVVAVLLALPVLACVSAVASLSGLASPLILPASEVPEATEATLPSPRWTSYCARADIELRQERVCGG